jgi:outer membrane protein
MQNTAARVTLDCAGSMEPMRPTCLLSIVVAATLLAGTAHAEQGDWLLRAGVSMLDPKETNLPDALGGDVVFDNAVSPTLSAAFMLTRNLATELSLAWPYEHDLDLKTGDGGVTGIGDLELLPAILSFQWHFNPDGRLQPFVGVGVNYTRFSSEHLDTSAAGLPDGSSYELDHSWGVAAQAGLNLNLSERWFLSADVRWIDLDADVKARVPETGVPPEDQVFRGQLAEIDPWIYGLHIGFRIGAPKAPVEAPVAAAPVAVAAPAPAPPAPVKCADGDNDGVCDADDKCPGTAAGVKVDSVGCPLEQRLKLKFDFDSAELRPESITELERLVKFMGQVPFATALIEGHTDSVGADAYNQSLSDRRAKAVFDYLTSRGVDPARLKSLGKGESEPVADNQTAEGRQENRRVLMIRTDSGR